MPPSMNVLFHCRPACSPAIRASLLTLRDRSREGGGTSRAIPGNTKGLAPLLRKGVEAFVATASVPFGGSPGPRPGPRPRGPKIRRSGSSPPAPPGPFLDTPHSAHAENGEGGAVDGPVPKPYAEFGAGPGGNPAHTECAVRLRPPVFRGRVVNTQRKTPARWQLPLFERLAVEPAGETAPPRPAVRRPATATPPAPRTAGTRSLPPPPPPSHGPPLLRRRDTARNRGAGAGAACGAAPGFS